MTYSTNAWREEFVLARDSRALGRAADVARLLHHGDLVPIVRGVYRHAAAVRSEQPDDGFLARLRAIHLRSEPPPVFAGLSAAAIWDLPLIGPPPREVVVAAPTERGGRSNATIRRTAAGAPAPTEHRNGLVVTSLARTVVDVARTQSLEQAVAVCDAALRGQKRTTWRNSREAIPRDELWSELAKFGRGRGTAAARFAIGFADGKSGSAGESVSRVSIHRLGLPTPILQQEFSDTAGFIGAVDFWWPDVSLIGEFDGVAKYVREEYTRGRDAADIVIAEKRREDRLRAGGPRVTRWGWNTARSLPLLRAHLLAAGLA